MKRNSQHFIHDDRQPEWKRQLVNIVGLSESASFGAVQFRHVGRERLDYLIKSLILCNDARKKEGALPYLGDPTEIALLVVAQKGGLDVEELRRRFPRLDGRPFTGKRPSFVFRGLFTRWKSDNCPIKHFFWTEFVVCGFSVLLAFGASIR